ncbi:MAG: type II toxin-antitoxin system VapC family toxin [Candidatus Korarchaeota archaeon]|nr:type II toxin-antitoxin system VapC family toxin [Candidatus Korarchaeota archaeon]
MKRSAGRLLRICSASLSRMKVYPAGELIMEALSIAMRYEITVYDSLYLALAVMRGADLATFDQKLRDVASEVGVKTFPLDKVEHSPYGKCILPALSLD